MTRTQEGTLHDNESLETSTYHKFTQYLSTVIYDYV